MTIEELEEKVGELSARLEKLEEALIEKPLGAAETDLTLLEGVTKLWQIYLRTSWLGRLVLRLAAVIVGIGAAIQMLKEWFAP